MKTTWNELTEGTLPPPHTIVWVKRKNGNIYLASRRDRALSTNTDPSQNTYWEGNPLDTAFNVNPHSQRLEPKHSFSDVTVESWQPVANPF